MQLNFIDRAALQLAPRWAANRLRARALANTLVRHYEAAQPGLRTDGWRRAGTDPNGANRGSLHVLRNHARDLVRNNSWARRGKRVIGNNAVGWGIVPTPVEAGTRAQNRARVLWKQWAATKQCDVTGKRNFAGIQRLAIDTIAESGEVIIRRYPRATREGLAIPMQLQVLEPDYLDTGRDGIRTVEGNRIIQGVEVNEFGRPVAYWLFSEHPGASIQFGTSRLLTGGNVSQRVPAEYIRHVFYEERPMQARGVTWYAPGIVNLKDFDEFEDAQLLRQKIAACFAAFVTDADGNGVQMGETSSNPLEQTITPGTIVNLPTGKNVEIASPPQIVDGNFDVRMLRKIAACLGITYEDLTGDYSKVNFSSARMARLAHWANVYDWQWNMLIPMLCEPVWEWAMEAAWIAGAIGEKPNADWTAQPMPMIDPDKEARAAILRVRGGMATPDQIVQEQGLDPDVFWEQYATSFERIDQHKIVLDSDARKRTQAGNDVTAKARAKGAVA